MHVYRLLPVRHPWVERCRDQGQGLLLRRMVGESDTDRSASAVPQHALSEAAGSALMDQRVRITKLETHIETGETGSEMASIAATIAGSERSAAIADSCSDDQTGQLMRWKTEVQKKERLGLRLVPPPCTRQQREP